MLPDISVPDTDIKLWTRDALVFYTDSVTKARRRGVELGEDGVLELLASATGSTAGGLAALIERTAIEFQDGVPKHEIGIVAVVAS